MTEIREAHGTGPQVYVEWGDTSRPGEYDYATCTTEVEAHGVMLQVVADGWTGDFVTGDAAYGDQRRAERIASARADMEARDDEARRIACTPVLNGPATYFLPQDRYGYVVTGISPTGSKVTLTLLEQPGAEAKTGECNGFPVIDHTYSEEELRTKRVEGRTVTAHRRGDGRYFNGSIRVVFGSAQFYRNHAD
jgi:hypothetical protein